MKRTFEYVKDALAAGYTRADARLIERYKGADIVSADQSDTDSKGYRYGIVAQLGLEDLQLVDTQSAPITAGGNSACSVPLSFTQEKNLLGQAGSITPMYEPGAEAAAVAALKSVIDDFRCIHPERPSLKEQAILNEDEDDIAPLLARMRLALEEGHPAVTQSKRSGEVVFAVDFPKFRADGSWWPQDSKHLSYIDPSLAREQMVFAGLL